MAIWRYEPVPNSNWPKHFGFLFPPMSQTFSLQIIVCTEIFPPFYRIISVTWSRANIITVGGLFKTIISHKLYKIEFSAIKIRCTVNPIQKTRGLYLIGKKRNNVSKKHILSKNLQLISCRLYLRNKKIMWKCFHFHQDSNLRPPALNPSATHYTIAACEISTKKIKIPT